MEIPPPGDYVAKLDGSQITELTKSGIIIYESDGGSLCAAMPCVISQGDHAGFTTKATVTLVKRDGTVMTASLDNLKQIFGWDGVDPFSLMDASYPDVEFKLAGCKHEEYEGKTGFKPGWVNPLNGGMKMPEPSDRRNVLAKYGSKFRALAGGTPASKSTSPKSSTPPAAKKTTPPPPTATGPTATMEEAWASLCENNPQLDQTGATDLWHRSIKEMFATENNSELTPHQWGALKEKFDNPMPA